MAPCWRLQFNLSDLYPLPRLGIAQIASVLRDKGHAVSLVDVIAEGWSPERFGQWVAAERAEVVGLSCTILSVREAFAFCAAARAAVPGVVTVVGGPGVGGWKPEQLFEHGGDAVDYFVRGEGEAAMVSLLEVLEHGGALSDVANLMWRDDGGIQENRKAGLLDLEPLPSPAWDLMPMDKYRLHPPWGAHPYATIMETARGCTYPCNFCCLSRPVKVREIDWIVEETTRLHKDYGLREIHFVDPTFTLDADRARAIGRALKALPFDIHWTCKTRVDHIDGALAEDLADAGCYGIAFGVESGADLVLAQMKKKLMIDTTREAFESCKKSGIRTIAYCLVAGPAESDETVQSTVNFMREIEADYVLYGIVDPDPANALTRQAIAEGKFTHEDLAEFYLGEGASKFQDTTVTGYPVPQAQQWLKSASSDFYLRPRYMWGRVRDLRSLQDARNLASGGVSFLRDLVGVTRHWRRRSLERFAS
jgi:radical SAM superfamily enzyme YgiQ (UPF0313 family)